MANVEDLNNEFETLLQKLECYFPNLNFREKSIATEWIKKLKKSNTSIDEVKLRVDFIEYFVAGIATVFNVEPFNKIPANETLYNLRYLLPPDHKSRSMELSPEDKKKQYIVDMYADISDNGEFLSEQPVPRDGAFFLISMKPIMNRY